jgi:hypothetical protein
MQKWVGIKQKKRRLRRFSLITLFSPLESCNPFKTGFTFNQALTP